MTITIPDDLAASLQAEAERQGVSAEALAIKGVQQVVPSRPPASEAETEGSLYDLLKDHIGMVGGSSEPWSIDCGRKFADGLAADQQKRR